MPDKRNVPWGPLSARTPPLTPAQRRALSLMCQRPGVLRVGKRTSFEKGTVAGSVAPRLVSLGVVRYVDDWHHVSLVASPEQTDEWLAREKPSP